MSKTFTLCPRSTVASTFNPRQYLQSLEIPKQISCVLRGTKRAIPRKLVKSSDCRVSRFLKTVPGCRVSVSFPVSSHQLYPGGRGRLARYLSVKTPSSPFLSSFIFCFLIQGNDDFSTSTFEKTNCFELSRALYLTHCPTQIRDPSLFITGGGAGGKARGGFWGRSVVTENPKEGITEITENFGSIQRGDHSNLLGK